MCNIAGYVGTREVAPILIEMMRREEGFSGGYYTGLATVNNEKLQMRKITGDLQYLLDHTDAAHLEGCTGIIHSRSKSGGGDAWAHPFLDGLHEEPEIAYVANGKAVGFPHIDALQTQIAEELLATGCRFGSKVQGNGIYAPLSDGSMVHSSDIMCQLISRYRAKCGSTHFAMDWAFCELPSRVVGLVIAGKEPDRISFARYDYPMFAAFAEHGAYFSSTPLAFPGDIRSIIPVPPCTCGYLTRDTLVLRELSAPGFTVAKETPTVIHAAVETIERMLSEGPKTFRELTNAIAPLYEKADGCPTYQTAHAFLYELEKQGRLIQTTQWLPGAKPGLQAPQLLLSLI